MFLFRLTTVLSMAWTSVFAAEVNIYSYRQPELIQPLLDMFSDETGIDTNVSFLKKGLVEKLKAEGDRSPADLVITTDIARLNAIVQANVTQAVSSALMQENIPAAFRDPKGHWFGLTMRARAVYASRTRVAAGEITTYEDLANPKWKGRICTRSGAHPYNLALISSIISHLGQERTQQWLQGLKQNLARKPQGNDRAQIKAIFAGECDIALGNTYYMGLMLQNEEQSQWANAVRIEFPIFEGNGTHVNFSGVAMTKAAPNRQEALKLMEFLASERAQEFYAEINLEYPLKPGSKPSELVASWGSFTPDTTPLMTIAALRPMALKLVELVNFDE